MIKREINLQFEKMFDYTQPIDADAEDGEALKISTWAKDVLKDGYFEKLTTKHASELMTAFIDSNGDTAITGMQLRAGIKALRNLVSEIERLSLLK